MKRSTFQKYLRYALLAITLFCVFAYTYDLQLGDGDGIIARFNLNPLAVFIPSCLIILLLLGTSSTRTWLSNVSLMFLSIFGILFVLEKLMPYVATYQAGVHESIQRIDNVFPYTSQDTIYFKNYRPNCQFRTQLRPVDGGRNILHQINSDGMRGPEVLPKNEKQQRVLLVGDSYIQATQVAYEESIGPQLDSLLGDSTDVIQHGFPSWSPLLEWNWVLRKGLEFDPDLVVLFLYTNDFYSGDAVGDSGYLPYTRFNQAGEPAGFDFSSLEEAHLPKNRNPWTLFKAGWRRLRLVRMISFLSRQAQARRTLAEAELPSYFEMSTEDYEAAYAASNATKDLLTVALWDYIALMRDFSLWSVKLQDRVQQSLQHVAGLQQSLTKEGIPLVVCLIPYPWQFPGENLIRKTEIVGWEDFVFPAGGLRDVAASFCTQKGIPFLDLYPTTAERKAADPDQQLYCPSDPHWTVEGHLMAAETVQQFIHSEGLLK